MVYRAKSLAKGVYEDRLRQGRPFIKNDRGEGMWVSQEIWRLRIVWKVAIHFIGQAPLRLAHAIS